MSHSPDGPRDHVLVASVLVSFAKSADGSPMALVTIPDGYEVASSPDGRNHVVYRRRSRGPLGGEGETGSTPRRLVLGDDFESEGVAAAKPTGNATTMVYGLGDPYLEAVTSIPGLPALYLCETPDSVTVTSDLHLLKCVEGISLRFDPAGIRDLASIGRPIEYRTLFSGVRMIPGGSRLTVRGGRATVEATWAPPASEPCSSWEEYTALQADTFDQAVQALDLRSCELSLSSGLDSRATLAGVVARGATVSALTVSGENECLDARTAARLCRAYGLEHKTIKLDEAFRRRLPELVARASLLSGGISSVWHAAQVHCYRVLGDPPPLNALSGYLGNQIGRRGTEGLTPRGVGTGLLDGDLMAAAGDEGPSWYAHAMQADGFLEPGFLIQQESTFGNLASYQIGNSHSVQQSAYAFGPLIENMWRLPASEPGTSSGSHVQNLKHLFLGEPMRESFQRRYINGVGGFVSTCPINWGWRSRGGVSATGLWWGGLTLLDAVVSSRFSNTKAAKVTRKVGVSGLHEFRPVHEWMHAHMKPFVYEELLSKTSLDSGLFEPTELRQALDDYYADGRGFQQIVLALDLALAARNFSATA